MAASDEVRVVEGIAWNDVGGFARFLHGRTHFFAGHPALLVIGSGLTAEELRAALRSLEAIRVAVAMYIGSEGCTCCQAGDHGGHEKALAELLGVPPYDDGSGYDWPAILAATDTGGNDGQG